MPVEEEAARLIDAVVRRSCGTDLITCRSSSPREVRAIAERVARELDAHGFVAMPARASVGVRMRRALAHRHVALFAFDRADERRALEWLRELPAVSPRAHAVVTFHSSAGASGEDSREARAWRFAQRGRHAQAERWYRASLEHGRRRGDETGQVVACRALVEGLWRRDRWDDAAATSRDLLRRLRQVDGRAEVARLLAASLVPLAELDEAEAVLSAASTERQIAGLPPHAGLCDVKAEVHWWRGDLDRVAQALAGSESVAGRLIAAARAFLRRDTAQLIELGHAERGRAPAAARFVSAVIEAMGAALTREVEAVRRAANHARRLARLVRCPRIVRLAHALVIESHVMAGLPPPWTSERSPAARARLPVLDRWFCEWLAAAARGARRREAAAARVLADRGVRIVESWRWGCADMHLIHAIPALLQIVQDAEDDLGALVGLCAWLRREARADAVAIVAPDEAIVAAEGWGERAVVAPVDRDDVRACGPGTVMVRAVVRYAGAVTGAVCVRGPEPGREALVEAAKTAAAVCGPALRARIDLVRALRDAPALSSDILGCSPSIAAVREAIARAAATPFAVLVEGESGTGKELVARAIHRLSPRRDRRFVAVNCAALTDELVEAELFGHTRGAFTGAVAVRTGLVEDAHGGSLFLDEVTELSPRAQAKLLRVLQERELRRVGENASRAVDVRVIAATNRPLADAVRASVFREDLLFRLAVVRIHLPPLRERLEDIPVLARAIWRSLTAETGKRAVLGPDVFAGLCAHGWPGNVRELQNAMAALLVAAPERGRVTARHLAHVLSLAPASWLDTVPLQQARARLERTAVAGALARHGGRRGLAARELGLTRQGLSKAMKRLGLSAGPESGVA